MLNRGDRVIDLSARIIVVDRDEKHGDIVTSDARVRRTDDQPIHIGGSLDTLTRAWVGPRDDAQSKVYYVGPRQLEPLRFGSNRKVRRYVIVGSMGSGKTELLARWVIKQAMMFRNAMIGVFAPTGARRRIIYLKIRRLMHPAWVKDVRTTLGEVELHNGVVLKFVALKEHSKDVGSPAAGLDLVAAAVDEEQDCSQESIYEVEMRGRAAPAGYYPLLSTCTIKDSPEWRERKQVYETREDCVLYRMLLGDNPFVSTAYMDALKQSMSPRAYRMRVDALDAPPEFCTYPDFSRDTHLRPRPKVGVLDITASICGSPFLLGHDPGTIYDVSLVLKAFQVHDINAPVWWVIGEITTQGHIDSHITKVLQHMHKEWGAGAKDLNVVADPYSMTSAQNKPTIHTYKRWAKNGVKIRPAAYSKRKGGAPGPGVVPMDEGIDVVNSLFLAQDGTVRLYLDVDDRGITVAPKLCAALEMSERNRDGKAEAEKKTKSDQSHWPASLRYAVWPYEKVRMSEQAWTKRVG